ncbi:MAG: prenyltransferase/squalene oxidase repeat-containing protein [Nitrolancea sp.]
MKSRLITLLVSFVFLLPLVGVAPSASAANDTEITQAVNWLTSQQQADGGYVGFGGNTDPGTTADVALSLAAAGVDPDTVSNGGPSMIDYLQSQTATYATTVGGAAKLILAAVASGDDPRDFGGQNLVQVILSHRNQSSGLFDPQLYVHAYAMIALSAANQTIPESAVTALEKHQAQNGGWAFDGSDDPAQTDSNTTAVAVEALVASSHLNSDSVDNGMSYLDGLRDDNGLYASQQTAGTPLVGDANSTALVIQALLASGQSPDSAAVTAAVTGLETLRNTDTGAFAYRSDVPGDNLLATVQALPALAGKGLPVWPLHAPGRTLAQAKSDAQPGDGRRCVYFEQTMHNACLGFLAYWQKNGGLDAFGYPLSEEFTFVDPATGRPTTMQYFERARFEWHPGSAPLRFDVQLGRLGSEALSTP